MQRIKWQQIVLLFFTIIICSCSVKDKEYMFKNISFHIPSGLVFAESINNSLELYNKEKKYLNNSI